MELSTRSQALLPLMRDTRRALHRHPEPSNAEHMTRRAILDALAQHEPDEILPMLETGVRAVYHGTGPAIAFRADMDALPIREASGCAFASENDGWMHACGHDGHMALLIGLAALLHARRRKGIVTPTVTLLFQPAEETVGGAQRLIEAGALENPHAEAVFGLHLMPSVPLGRIGVRPGALMAQTVEFDIDVVGQRAHGALPHQGKDALLAATHLYTQMQTLLTRVLYPFDTALLSIGKFAAGEARNVVAAHAHMECMLRTFKPHVYDRFRERVEGLLAGLSQGFGVTGTLTELVHYPAVINDEALTALVLQVLGDAAIAVEPMMIAEDFSFYQRARPGVFAFLGCGDAEHDAALHGATFDFDERALAIGLCYYERLLDRYANQ